MYMTKAILKVGERGGSGALAAFLAGSAEHIGKSHHLVWSLFGDQGGERPFLFRQTGSSSDPILIYSTVKPVDGNNLWNLDVREFELPSNLKAGDRVAWSIRVNATMKSENTRHCIVARERRNGDADHVEVVASKVVRPWLSKKLEAVGLQSADDDMMVEAFNRMQFIHDPRRYSKRVTIAVTDLKGVGTVTDAEKLKVAVEKGIGAGKAYGCGMLLLRRAK